MKMSFRDLVEASGETMPERKTKEVEVRSNADTSAEMVMLPGDKLFPNPNNPRLDLGDLEELTDSIRKNGIMQNLVVVPKDDGYMVLIGHRRLEAGKAAGLTEFPCKVIDEKTAAEQVSIMLEENLQRSDLTAYEQGQGFQMMLDLGETENTIAEKTGFSKSTIRRRINIAMLDKEVLKEKEDEDGFQMRLSDLYELEKVDDLNARNRILQTASSSDQISFKVNDYLNDQSRNKRREDIVKWLEESGVKQAPDEMVKNQYHSKYEVIKSFYLQRDEDEEFDLPDREMWYIADNYYVSVMAVKVKVKAEKTPEEIKAAELKSRGKKINKIYKDTCEKRREFIVDFVNGKYKLPKDKSGMMETLWNLMREGTYGRIDIGESDVKQYIAGCNLWDLNDEEKERLEEIVKDLPVLLQMIICTARQQKEFHIAYENATQVESKAKMVQDFDEILGKFGFVLEDEEQAVIDGTSDLYKKAQEEAA